MIVPQFKALCYLPEPHLEGVYGLFCGSPACGWDLGIVKRPQQEHFEMLCDGRYRLMWQKQSGRSGGGVAGDFVVVVVCGIIIVYKI